MTGDSGTRMPDPVNPHADPPAADDRGLNPVPDQNAAPEPATAHPGFVTTIGDRGGLAGLDTGRAHPARIYDYWVGGRDNFAADRQAGARVAELAPWVMSGARGNRAFLGRAVSWLAKAGIDQYLDIGAGLPGAGNVHEVAQVVNPAARTVYVDNDELVLVHARALLTRDDRTTATAGDARNPAAILTDPQVRSHLDLDRPTAVLLVAVLHFIVDHEQATRIVADLRGLLAPGSYLVISHVADLPDTIERPGRAEATREAVKLYEDLAAPFVLRGRERIAGLFAGFDLVEPGLVAANDWRPRRGRPGPAVPVLAGVGRLQEPDTSTGIAVPASTGFEPAATGSGDSDDVR